MSKVFFGKMNDQSQIAEKIYRTADKSFLGDISVGDYAFIKLEKETMPATVKRLWKLVEINEKNGEYVAVFEELFQFPPIQLLKFEALDFFVLDVNLLNKCNKQTKGLSFYNLSIVNDCDFDKIISSEATFMEYISDEEHYRKFIRLEEENQIDFTTKNIQFYDRGDIWMLVDDVPFIGSDLKANYDSSQFDLFDKYGKKGSNTSKDKMYSFLKGSNIDVPMMGLWDLFCGTVKENSGATKKSKNSSEKRLGFIEYCKSNGILKASAQYETGLRMMEKELEVDADEEYEKDKCVDILERIKVYVSGLEEGQIGNRKNWPYYVSRYVEYRDHVKASTDEKNVADNNPENAAYNYSEAKFCGLNKVFYGTPGCGKSYYVENTVLVQEEIDSNSVFRTTFFQDYTNTDFVGQILPKIEGDIVKYEFVPGPFTLALKCAIDNPDEKVALIIEELNRGNAPSIFGDIFQLLDRKDGESSYSIVNVNIINYLKQESLYEHEYIKIPANLYIFATMNTSDQNVYTLDTAFKRRWKFEKLTNDFLSKDTISNKYVPGLNNVSWKTFVETINNFIISHATSLSAEDKQLGKYFIDEEMLLENMDDDPDVKIKDFAYKVFEYIWADVSKFNRNEWFISDINSLDVLMYKYINHENIFVESLASVLPIYSPTEEEA